MRKSSTVPMLTARMRCRFLSCTPPHPFCSSDRGGGRAQLASFLDTADESARPAQENCEQPFCSRSGLWLSTGRSGCIGEARDTAFLWVMQTLTHDLRHEIRGHSRSAHTHVSPYAHNSPYMYQPICSAFGTQPFGAAGEERRALHMEAIATTWCLHGMLHLSGELMTTAEIVSAPTCSLTRSTATSVYVCESMQIVGIWFT